MKNRPSQAMRQARLAPLDHLKPGGRGQANVDDAGEAGATPRADERSQAGATPAEPVTPGSGDSEAVRGKATSTPAAVPTRRHLEGSEQGPQ